MTATMTVRRSEADLESASELRPGAALLRWGSAVMVPVAISTNLPVGAKLTLGMVVVYGLAPFWVPVFFKTRHAALLTAATALFFVTGVMVAWASRSDHEVPHGAAITSILTLGMFLGGIGAVVWAARVLGPEQVVLVWGVSVLLEGLSQPWPDNYMKFLFIYPIELAVLSFLGRRTYPAPFVLLVLAGLGVLCATNDYRSGFAMFIVTIGILAWQSFRRQAVREPSIVALMIGLISTGGFVYYTVTRLLVSGALGPELKARSEAQVEASGSLLLGGRPEWTVTIRLFQDRWQGFGFGAVPSPGDYELGREGFASIHLLSQVNYLKNYMLGGGFRLHSILAELWVAAGPAGILLACVLIWVLVSTLATDLAHRVATPSRVFLTILALWNMGFSPAYSNFNQLTITLGLALAGVAMSRRGPPDGSMASADGRSVPTYSGQER